MSPGEQPRVKTLQTAQAATTLPARSNPVAFDFTMRSGRAAHRGSATTARLAADDDDAALRKR
ncbi:MAG: hypothetical protein ACREXI_00605, partial [Caldimonas sp.]